MPHEIYIVPEYYWVSRVIVSPPAEAAENSDPHSYDTVAFITGWLNLIVAVAGGRPIDAFAKRRIFNWTKRST